MNMFKPSFSSLDPRRIRLPKPRRSVAIPAIIAAIAILTIVGIEAKPFIPYWAAGDPWQHSHLIPDRTAAHLQVDLKTINADNIDFLQDSIPSGALPGGFIQAAPDFAGRYASVSLLSNDQWAVILDLRDAGSAQRFIQQSADPRLRISDGRLIISPNDTSADLIRDYRREANSFSLRDSRHYRHAILNRPDSLKGRTGLFFIRWSAMPAAISEEASLLAGCDPDQYLAGTFSWEPHYRIDATCTTISGVQSPLPALPDIKPPPDTDLFMQAAFPTDPQHIEEMVTITGLPVLAQTYLLLDTVPATPQPVADPFHDDDGLEPWTAGPSALDSLLRGLDGSITVTLQNQRLKVNLPHSDRASIEKALSGLRYAGISADGLSLDDAHLSYEKDLSLPGLHRQQGLPPAPCPEGPRNIIIRSGLPFFTSTLPLPTQAPSLSFCYTSERRDTTTKLSVIISTTQNVPKQ